MFDGFFGGYTLGTIVTLIIMGVAIATDPEGPGYKQGQVDALNGKVKYVLIENPDKTKEWIRDAEWDKS